MKIEAATAIACRNEIEVKVVLRFLQKADIRWKNGKRAMEPINEIPDNARIYIVPPNTLHNRIYLQFSDEPDNFDYDDEDPFTWIYVEASEIFRNQIISERRKNEART